jgi:hypothetical protein
MTVFSSTSTLISGDISQLGTVIGSSVISIGTRVGTRVGLHIPILLVSLVSINRIPVFIRRHSVTFVGGSTDTS